MSDQQMTKEATTCPFCDAPLTIVRGKYACPGGGRLLIPGWPCPLTNQLMTQADIQRTAVALIDAEME